MKVVMIAAALLLSACGQKGPLYLPEPQTAAAQTDETAEQNQAQQEAADE